MGKVSQELKRKSVFVQNVFVSNFKVEISRHTKFQLNQAKVRYTTENGQFLGLSVTKFWAYQ